MNPHEHGTRGLCDTFKGNAKARKRQQGTRAAANDLDKVHLVPSV
jgi:hypothetical protein